MAVALILGVFAHGLMACPEWPDTETAIDDVLDVLYDKLDAIDQLDVLTLNGFGPGDPEWDEQAAVVDDAAAELEEMLFCLTDWGFPFNDGDIDLINGATGENSEWVSQLLWAINDGDEGAANEARVNLQ